MKNVSTGIASVLAVAFAARLAAVESPPLEHVGLECVASESFVRVVAGWPGSRAPVSARVEFRTGADDAWYAVAMRTVGAELVGFLPRPGAGLDGFEYRIQATDAAGHRSLTRAYSVRVSAEPSCLGSAGDPGGAIVVDVPPGRPAVPPVPQGFNPAGAVGATEAAGNKPRRLGPIAGGAAVLAGLGGLAAVFGGHASEPSGGSENTIPAIAPHVRLVAANPPPGSTLTVGDPFDIALQLSARAFSAGASYRIDLDFLDPATSNPCVRVSSQFTFQPVVSVSVSGTTEPIAPCGETFDTQALRVFVRQLSFETVILTGTEGVPDLIMPYHFVR